MGANSVCYYLSEIWIDYHSNPLDVEHHFLSRVRGTKSREVNVDEQSHMSLSLATILKSRKDSIVGPPVVARA